MTNDQYYEFAKKVFSFGRPCLRDRYDLSFTVELTHGFGMHNKCLKPARFNNELPDDFNTEQCMFNYFQRHAKYVDTTYQSFGGFTLTQDEARNYFSNPKEWGYFRAISILFTLQFDNHADLNKSKLSQPELHNIEDLGW